MAEFRPVQIVCATQEEWELLKVNAELRGFMPGAANVTFSDSTLTATFQETRPFDIASWSFIT